MDFAKKVTTASADCRQCIDQGVFNMYGFNNEEALRCFRKALGFDSNCAMAHYFIAFNLAANYNNPGGFDYDIGFQEARKALEIAHRSVLTELERALIEALVHRFCDPAAPKSLKELHKNYANAMRPVYHKFGNSDADVAALFAESLMMLAPWELWTAPPDIKPAIVETEELLGVLEKALEISPTHPALCHFYIHVMELSATPDAALPAAEVLRSRYDHGHLLHMPSHIYMWLGQYEEAIESNKIAIAADEAYVLKTGNDNEFYKMYRMHNYHFLAWACMFDGQFALALESAEGAERQLGVEAVTYKLGDTPLGSIYLESFSSIPWHVLVRFGKWEDIINRPLKENKDAYAGTIATAHYARGIAYAVMGRLKEADAERKKFYDALRSKSLENRCMFNNVMHDAEGHRGILDVAEAVLNGEVEYHKGNFQEAFQHLHVAVQRDLNLLYEEPWGWMTPARHVLGALLLEHGDAPAAEAVYREDLKKYKNNLWSLLGLYQALNKQKKTEEAERVYDLYQKVSVRADVDIGASCLCATKLCSN